MSIFLKTDGRIFGFIIDFKFIEKRRPLSILAIKASFLRQNSTFALP